MEIFTRTLSTRLQKVYEQLLPAEDVWDICCDHGYLGLKAFMSGQFAQIHFVDPALHLIEALRQRCGGSEGLHFHALPAQEVGQVMAGNVVVAGVGAELISEIVLTLLAQGQLRARRLILLPHKQTEKIRLRLAEQAEFAEHYSLREIHPVVENGRLREVFVFEPRL